MKISLKNISKRLLHRLNKSFDVIFTKGASKPPKLTTGQISALDLAIFSNNLDKRDKDIDENLYTTFKKDDIVDGMSIIYAPPTPKFIDIGNLNYEKRFDEAIYLGNQLLTQCPAENISYKKMLHINLMVSYFKARIQDPSYLELSNYHAKMAIVYGHNTGYAQERLAINLEKSGRLYGVVELCDIMLSDKFDFSTHAMGTKEQFRNRKNKILLKISKSKIIYDEIPVFTNEEIDSIFKNSKPDLFN